MARPNPRPRPSFPGAANDNGARTRPGFPIPGTVIYPDWGKIIKRHLPWPLKLIPKPPPLLEFSMVENVPAGWTTVCSTQLPWPYVGGYGITFHSCMRPFCLPCAVSTPSDCGLLGQALTPSPPFTSAPGGTKGYRIWRSNVNTGRVGVQTCVSTTCGGPNMVGPGIALAPIKPRGPAELPDPKTNPLPDEVVKPVAPEIPSPNAPEVLPGPVPYEDMPGTNSPYKP